MKLNLLERVLITSPVRPFLQKHLEAKQLLKTGGPAPGAIASEMAVGQAPAVSN